ncbi:MAG: hypothetical protein OHK0046_35840 [Anaerolineae bacterium]
MAIELFWDNDEQNIMLCVFDKQWTWDEMFETLEKIKKVTDKRDYEIGAIIDVSAGISIPGGSIFSPDVREKAKRLLSYGDEGRGPIAVVGAGGAFKMFSSAFTMLDKNAMRDTYFANSLDEARQMMAKRLKQRVTA